MNNRIKTMANAAMFAALTFVAIRFLQIPAPLYGYIHLGDCFVILTGWFFSPIYAFLAAGIGSALADLLSPFALYTPATFIIKGVMAIIAGACFKLLVNKLGKTPSRLISGALAGIFMILGYYIFEGILYGFIPPLVNIPANGVQASGGILFSWLLGIIMDKSKIFKK